MPSVSPRISNDRGSAMMLVPAAVLVMLILAAIGADLSKMHMARSALEDLSYTIANDISTGALDRDRLRADGTYAIKPDAAGRIRDDRTQVATLLPGDTVPSCIYSQDDTTNPLVVTVTCTASAQHFFGRGIPGAGDAMPLVATSTLTLEEEG
jgi:hypothetical protein